MYKKKGMISMRMLIPSYIIHNKSYSMFAPNFKILGRVVSEKSLIEKKVHRQTHRKTMSLKRQKLYSPYIFCMPGV